jgi:MFS family permease
LENAGVSKTLIGLNTSTYYLGVALAAPFVPCLMRRSARGCVVAGMVIDGLTTAVFPWTESLGGWFLLRLLGGVASALSLIPMETLVNHNAARGRRARDFGLYAFSVAAGIGLGATCGLSLFPLAPRLTFLLGGLVTLAALAALRFEMPWGNTAEAEQHAERSAALGDSVLSFGTAWVQGFLEGGMMTFLSLYLLTLGYREGEVGWLLGGLFLGVMIAQLPLAEFADRLGRLRVLLACHALLLAGLVFLPFCAGPLAVGVWLFLLGAACGALYPLGLAVLGERTPQGALAKANAWYLASNCVGSLTGPVVLGLAIDGFGRFAQFAASAVSVLVVLALWAIRRLTARRSHRGGEATPSRPLPQLAGTRL